MKKWALICILSVSVLPAMAQVDDTQQIQLDTLKKSISVGIEDTNTVDELMSMATGFIDAKGSGEMAIEYGQKALEIEKRFNYKRRLGFIYRKLGNLYYERLKNYEKGLECYFESLKLYQQINDKRGIANCYNNIGNIYNTKGGLSRSNSDYDTALLYLTKALTLREEIGDKSNIDGSYLNLGETYLDKHDYEKAIEYLLKANTLYSTSTPDSNGMLLAYTSLSRAYLAIGNTQKALQYINWCKDHFENEKFEYYELMDQPRLAEAYTILGEIYLKLNDYTNALNYLQKALTVANNGNYEELKERTYSLLAQLYGKKNNYADAYKYLTLSVTLKDSLLNVQAAKDLEVMEKSYIADRKEREMELTAKDNELNAVKQNKHRMGVRKTVVEIYALIITLILLIISFMYIRKRYQANKKEGNPDEMEDFTHSGEKQD